VHPDSAHTASPSPRGTRATRWPPVVAVAAFALITTIIGLRMWDRLEVPGQPDLPLYAMQDFRDTIYYPVRTLLLGSNPYSPSAIRRLYAPGSTFPLYTPIHFAVHLPYGLVSQRTGELVHFVLVTILTVVIGFVCLRLCRVPTTVTNVFGLATFVLASKAGYQGLFFGQVAASLVLATYGALRFAHTQPRLAGACLAFTCLKPSFGVPLVVLLLANGAFATVAIGAILAATTSLIMGAFVWRAAGGWQPLLASLHENVATWSALPEARGATGISSVDTVALIDRWWDLPPALEVALSLAILALGAAAVARATRTHRETPLLAWSIAILTMLVFTHHQFYDVLLVALPVVALVSGRIPLAADGAGQALRWGLVALLTLAAFNHLSSYEILDGYGIVGAARTAIVSATGIALTSTLLALVYVALAHTPPRPSRVDG
jgi:glycosyl transferase family 87